MEPFDSFVAHGMVIVVGFYTCIYIKLYKQREQRENGTLLFTTVAFDISQPSRMYFLFHYFFLWEPLALCSPFFIRVIKGHYILSGCIPSYTFFIWVKASWLYGCLFCFILFLERRRKKNKIKMLKENGSFEGERELSSAHILHTYTFHCNRLESGGERERKRERETLSTSLPHNKKPILPV